MQEFKTPGRIGPYTLKGTIGNGAFSVVKLCENTSTGEFYACKAVPRQMLIDRKLQSRFETEIRIMQQMRHPNIVQLYDIKKDSQFYYVIMEFCPNGELFQHIIDKKYLQEREARIFLRQIASALAFIHKMGAAHRDLKPENLLLDKWGNVKITDFGFSIFVGSSRLASTACGSPCYASPEVLSGSPYEPMESDVWSLGVIFYAMLTGQLPWTKKNQAQLFDQIKKGDYKIPAFLTDNCRDLISKMMCVDPQRRVSAAEILESKWMNENSESINVSAPLFGVSLRAVDSFFDADGSFYPPANEDSFESSRETDAEKVENILTFLGKEESKLPMLVSKTNKSPPNAADAMKHRKINSVLNGSHNSGSEFGQKPKRSNSKAIPLMSLNFSIKAKPHGQKKQR